MSANTKINKLNLDSKDHSSLLGTSPPVNIPTPTNNNAKLNSSFLYYFWKNANTIQKENKDDKDYINNEENDIDNMSNQSNASSDDVFKMDSDKVENVEGDSNDDEDDRDSNDDEHGRDSNDDEHGRDSNDDEDDRDSNDDEDEIDAFEEDLAFMKYGKFYEFSGFVNRYSQRPSTCYKIGYSFRKSCKKYSYKLDKYHKNTKEYIFSLFS